MLLGWFGVHAGIRPNVSTPVAVFIASVTDWRVIVFGSAECSMIVLRCHSAIQERIGLVLSLSRWLFFEPSDAMSAVMFFSTGHVFVLAVAGGISALKYICLPIAPRSLTSLAPKVPRLDENFSLEPNCCAACITCTASLLPRGMITPSAPPSCAASTNCWKSVVPAGTLETPMISAP